MGREALASRLRGVEAVGFVLGASEVGLAENLRARNAERGKAANFRLGDLAGPTHALKLRRECIPDIAVDDKCKI